jgi:hypothetical protein
MGGAVWHAWTGLDIYAYGGIEKEDASWYGWVVSSGTLPALGPAFLGLGNPNLTNLGCNITTAASFSGGTSNCNGTNHWVTDITVGLWQNLYSGDIGRSLSPASCSQASAPTIGLSACCALDQRQHLLYVAPLVSEISNVLTHNPERMLEDDGRLAAVSGVVGPRLTGAYCATCEDYPINARACSERGPPLRPRRFDRSATVMRSRISAMASRTLAIARRTVHALTSSQSSHGW